MDKFVRDILYSNESKNIKLKKLIILEKGVIK